MFRQDHANILNKDAAVDLQRDVAIQCIELGLLARLNAILSPDLITSADPQALNDIEVELPEARVERLKEHDKLASKVRFSLRTVDPDDFLPGISAGN
ncbi:MAG: hypothetical protein LQ341_007789 [Variospora aurantia]|nr:MAG: hypothetical protein LQ341_007789 [Variospora aurantia]